MRTLIYPGLIALLALTLTAACNRTVDNTDDKTPGTDITGADLAADPDSDGVDPGEDTTVQPPKDVTIPEGCGTLGVTVNDLQTKDEGLNCVEPAEGESGFINLDQGVELNCLIATTPVHDMTETLEGFYAADVGGGPYSGIKVVMDKGTAPEVAIGDVVSMVGDLKEYYCLSEFDVLDVQVFANNGAPVATVVTPEEFNADPEKFEGVLVEFKNVAVLEHDTYGGFKIEGNIIVDDAVFSDMPLVDPGCTYDSLVGVVDFGYGKYKVLPRVGDDLKVAAGECDVVVPETQTIDEIQDSSTSNTCTGEAFVNVGPVSLAGLVVATPRYVASDGKLHGFFATTPGGSGPYSGVLVATEWSKDIDLEVGTEFDLEADWTEFYCLTELKATKITETGENKAGEISPSAITPQDIGEGYEGVVVKLSGTFTVEEAVNNYGEVTLSDGIIIKAKFDGFDWDPSVDDVVTEVVGALDYSFDKYKIMPVSNDDVITQ
jgi:hypothetical protein